MRVNLLMTMWILALVPASTSCRRAPSHGASRVGIGNRDKSARPAPAGSLALGPRAIEAGALGLITPQKDVNGRPVRIACRTCHGKIVRPGLDAFRRSKAVFHAHIRLEHGTKTCRTCHRMPYFDDFNLADGSAVPAPQVMRVCGQCHSRRLEEYLRGAHGGASGYWDRRKGPQKRNHCLDCHDAHHPRIDRVQPATRARNR